MNCSFGHSNTINSSTPSRLSRLVFSFFFLHSSSGTSLCRYKNTFGLPYAAFSIELLHNKTPLLKLDLFKITILIIRLSESAESTSDY